MKDGVCTKTDACTECGECKEACPRSASGEAGVDLDQVHLPDPVQMQIAELLRRIETLERQAKEKQMP